MYNPDDIEEEFMKEQLANGYKEGLERGKAAGRAEGTQLGSEQGAKIGFEVGYYKGYMMTWTQLLRTDQALQAKSPKALSKLDEALQLIDNFPKSNSSQCEEQLLNIRLKYKQSLSLLNLKS